jgi:hypothetical protein
MAQTEKRKHSLKIEVGVVWAVGAHADHLRKIPHTQKCMQVNRRNIIIIFGMTARYVPQSSLHFLTTGFLWGGAVNPTPNSQPGGPGLHTFDPRKQDDPTIPPGTGYPFSRLLRYARATL